MANTQLVNGKVYDWSSVTISTSGIQTISQRWSPTNLTQGAEFPANRQNNTMMM